MGNVTASQLCHLHDFFHALSVISISQQNMQNEEFLKMIYDLKNGHNQPMSLHDKLFS